MSIPNTQTFECPIRQQAVSCPDDVAISSKGVDLSYKSLDRIISSIAHQLAEQGIRKHTKLAILLDSNVEYIILLFALFRLKSVGVAMNSRFPDAVILDLLNRIDCNYIVTDGRYPLLTEDQNLKHLLVDEFEWHDPTLVESRPLAINANQQATIIYSSGSTGTPKAILHSFGNHYFSAIGSNQNITIIKGNRWLLSLPLYHVAGIAILFRSFVAGATVVIPEPGKSLDQIIQVSEVSHLSLVTTQLQQVLQSGNRYPGLEAVLVGGSSVSALLRKESFSAGLPVFFSYGLSEMSSQVTTTSLNPSSEEVLSSGTLLPYRSLQLSDDGEILVQGDTLFLGYIDNQTINLPLNNQGWFATGDLGRFDDKGRLFVLGRKDNMFISGGENIYPEQIERVIQLYDAVQKVMVVPVEDERFGYRPVAFIDAEDFARVKKDVPVFLNGKLARYMHPIAYFSWKSGPERVGIKDSRKEFARRAEELIRNESKGV